MKLAILSTYPFRTGRTDMEHIYGDISGVIKNDIEIEFFSLSDANATTKFSGYIQHEIKGFAPRHGYTPKVAMVDYLHLFVFSRKYSPTAIKNNKLLFESLEQFNPDFMMTSDPAFCEFAEYFTRSTKTKFLFMTDAWTRKRYNVVWWDELSGRKLKFLYPISRKRYVNYAVKVFDSLLSSSTAVILSSAFHQDQFKKLFPKYANKAYWVPHHIIQKVPKRHIKKGIKNILYIGANDSWVVKTIEDFARMLPSKTVTVAGYGFEKHVVGNVDYFGSFKESDKDLLFGQADVCIAPIPAPTGGRRAKLFDYFLYGRPVIGTTYAFEGYDAIDKKNAIIEDDIGKFANAVLWLEKHPKIFAQMQRLSPSLLKDATKSESRRLWHKLLRHLANK